MFLTSGMVFHLNHHLVMELAGLIVILIQDKWVLYTAKIYSAQSCIVIDVCSCPYSEPFKVLQFLTFTIRLGFLTVVLDLGFKFLSSELEPWLHLLGWVSKSAACSYQYHIFLLLGAYRIAGNLAIWRIFSETPILKLPNIAICILSQWIMC